jgi:protein-S-isoprenylcysteine O-methyltransferase Ste14
MRELLRKHGQTIINIVLVVCLGHYALERGAAALRQAQLEHTVDLVETAFFVHNVVMLTLILVRRPHQAIDKSVLHQAVALVAFFSGITFVRAPEPGPVMVALSQVVTAAAIILGTAALVNLGRSFGILVSVRKVRTNGLYAAIRHPMYFTDILWRVGITLKDPCPVNFTIFVASSACYVYRALLEEEFLSRVPEYRDYMQKVRYRFLPGVF